MILVVVTIEVEEGRKNWSYNGLLLYILLPSPQFNARTRRTRTGVEKKYHMRWENSKY